MNGNNAIQKTILLMSANPKGMTDLNLSNENRKIDRALQLGTERDSFNIEVAQAVCLEDIDYFILRHKPFIVHFSGHGTGEKGLVFEDEKLVDAEALAGMFALLAGEIDCVVLNACYSEIQAKAIAKHINYVIGMNQPIGDCAAIEFADGFYKALGFGKDVEQAYQWGCNAIQRAGIPEHLTPQLLRKKDFSGENIDTNLEPVAPPEDTHELTLVSASSTPIQPTSLSLRQKETIITQYRQQVEEFASDGLISEIESHILNDLKKKLELTDEIAREILKEVLEPFQTYKQLFTKHIAASGYPLDENTQAELNKLQKYYNLKEDYISLLNKEIEQQQAKKGREEKKVQKPQQENKNNHPRDERDLLKVVQGEYSFNKIEKPILSEKEAEFSENLPRQQKETDEFSSTKKVNYTRLRDLLKGGKWKEANEETLAIMLKVAGKEKQGRLSSSSMKNFPSTDLHAIDQLWLEHSNQQFGFSVQKQNWFSVSKNWQKFGESIGWRGNNRWLDYNNLTFNLDAPQGHLPAMWEGKLSEWGLIGSWLDYLLSDSDL
jgi:hypothetical protein